MSLTSAGNQDIFVWKTDPSGNSSWVQRGGGDAEGGILSTDRGNHITVGANGDLFVSGIFSVTADFGTDQLTSAGGWDGFFWNLDTAGNHVAAWRMGGTGNDQAGGSALDEAGNAYLTGSYRNTADFPTGDVLPVSGDFFIMKFAAGPPEPGITVSPTSGLVTSEDPLAASDTFTVVLDTQPTADVTIGISSSDTTEGTPDVAGLTFTSANWDTPQTVTVTGVDDADLDGNVAYALVTAAATSTDPAYDGLNASDVSVTNLDNEVPAGVTVSGITPNTMSAKASISVTISGSGFADGAGVTFTGGAGKAPTASNIVVAADGNSITATVSTHKKAKESSWDVVVTNPDSSTDACVDCFSVTTSSSASATAAATQSTAASFDAGTSDDASDDTTIVSVAAPQPSTDSGTLSSIASEPVTTSTDEADTVDEALADFDAGPLDDALLEDLAVALVG